MNVVNWVAYGCGIAFAIGFPIAIVFGVLTAHRMFRSDSCGTVSSGLGAAMTEIDRMIRPSAEQLQQVNDEILDQEEIDGE